MKATECQWPECTATIEQAKRGRPRKFCPEHAQTSTAAAKRLYKSRTFEQDLAKAIDSRLPQCCQDCQQIHPRRKQCDQHKQWSRFRRQRSWRPGRRHSRHDSPEEAQLGDAIENGLRITRNPDSWKPDLFSPNGEYTYRGACNPRLGVTMKTYRRLPTTPERDAMLAIAATALGLDSSDDLIAASVDATLMTLIKSDPVLGRALYRAGGAEWDAIESLMADST